MAIWLQNTSFDCMQSENFDTGFHAETSNLTGSLVTSGEDAQAFT